MKYEIQKRSMKEPNVWCTIAWTDVRSYADMIVSALDSGGRMEFIVKEVRKDG